MEIWSSPLWYASYLLVLIGLAGYGFHRLTIVYLYLRHARRRPEPLRQFEELPLVTVQLPVFNELHVVDRLLDSVAALDYPQDKLQIQVLDDSTDETTEICQAGVARLQAMGFDAQLIHRVDRTGYKAGALENGTQEAKGEYLFILDADFVPNPDVLQRTIHYFSDDRIGMIQTRWGHLNRTFNVLTRIQAMFLDGHLELEQTARNRSGRFFTFNGTAGIWRKSCIADAGGWEHDTLTEDMDLSYRAQLNGWRFIFLNEVETPAELPVDMDGFKSQQHRWTKGSIQVCKKVLPAIWKSKVPLYVKMEATAHLTSNFAYLLLICLCFLIYPNQHAAPDFGPLTYYIVNVPIFFFASVSVIVFYLTSQKALRPGSWWREIPYLPLLLALGIGMSINNAKAVLEAIFNHQSGFVRTPKYGIDQSRKTDWKKSSYKAIKSLTPVIELLFGCFFLFVVVEAAMDDRWSSAILLLPFPVGFFYTSLSSIVRMLPGPKEEKSAD
ncbi:cellulose synthase/poly-beta-1,6-N-acetylglucosamine synthase-like glycosyltransferase [Haloferula luteola]|uniref:Cellulose synthase/poly-beta-1,6-N-acetylglucosamine synthase-like glycosyltransferase n=1 Tax=Haloferula luteola TaxID=595692 RepID=A0A840V5Z4_9BACT|nr:cellulose synthase family protein [Haloferula luteola]MBB5351044.1 cellulose synthase/poly-beta-1,6-N-acetylglucosamine synthase-like glycosyltransferase [Haloferula luteola]